MEYNIMRELNVNEMKEVNGGTDDDISGFEGAGAIMAVVGFGSLFTPIGIVTGGIAIGSAAGLAIAEFISLFTEEE